MDDKAVCTRVCLRNYVCYIVGKGMDIQSITCPSIHKDMIICVPPPQSVHDRSDVYQHLLQSWSGWAGTDAVTARPVVRPTILNPYTNPYTAMGLSRVPAYCVYAST